MMPTRIFPSGETRIPSPARSLPELPVPMPATPSMHSLLGHKQGIERGNHRLRTLRPRRTHIVKNSLKHGFINLTFRKDVTPFVNDDEISAGRWYPCQIIQAVSQCRPIPSEVPRKRHLTRELAEQAFMGDHRGPVQFEDRSIFRLFKQARSYLLYSNMMHPRRGGVPP